MPPVTGPVTVGTGDSYKLIDREHLVEWLAPLVCEAGGRGDCDAPYWALGDHAYREARILRVLDTWNERTARLFACDCVEHALPFYCGEHYPGGEELRNAIVVTRRYANDQAKEKEWNAALAAWFIAAWPCVEYADGLNSGDAAWSARRTSMAAAMAAAGAAIRGSDWIAACRAAEAAERAWQTERLMGYLYPHDMGSQLHLAHPLRAWG